MIVEVVRAGLLDVLSFLDDGRAELFVACDDEKVIQVLKECEGMPLVREQVGASLAFPKSSLDMIVKVTSASD
jgi:hypothetical protein